MKEIVKKYIFMVSALFSIVVVCMMITSYKAAYKEISLHDTNINKVLLNKYKNELSTIKDSDCKKAVEEIVKHYEDTSYDGKVDLRDKYFNGKSILGYTLKTFDSCNLTDEQKGILSSNFITSSIQFEEIVNELYFQYELSVPDSWTRSTLKPTMDNVRYRINRSSHLDLIGDLIQVLKEGK